MNVVKLGTLELVSAAISEMDAAVLSAKKERKPDRQAHRHCCPAQSLRQTPATRSLRLISPGELDTIFFPEELDTIQTSVSFDKGTEL